MKFITLKIPAAVLAMLCAAAAVSADIKIKTKMGAGGQSFESLTYIKGARQRTDQGPGLTMLYQCDLKRMIQLNDNAKTYMITPLDEQNNEGAAIEKTEPEKRPQTKTRRGGVITFTSTAADTGERKEMFGFTARRIKTSMVKEATPDACDPKPMRMESDGWYIDLEYGLYCSSDKPAAPPQTRFDKPDCIDEIRFKQIGKAKLGYPLVISTTIYGEDGKSFTTSTEVVELSKSSLDQSLFEIPSGYREVKNFQELMGMSSIPSMTERMPSRESDEGEGADDADRSAAVDAKRPGAIRIGVVAFNSRIDLKASLDSMRYALIGNIQSSNIDAVPLNAQSPAEIEAEAKSKQCDFLLYTDVSEMKKPSTASKIGGGMLGKIGGLGGGGKYETRVDFRLFPVGSSSARLTSAATAKEEGGEEAALSNALEKEAKAVASEVQKRR